SSRFSAPPWRAIDTGQCRLHPPTRYNTRLCAAAPRAFDRPRPRSRCVRHLLVSAPSVAMAMFSRSDAQLAFGHVALLDHADFALEAGERVGLIGRNGTGKSSLLKIIAGQAALDDGLVSQQNGLTTAYVAQEPDFDPQMSVY